MSMLWPKGEPAAQHGQLCPAYNAADMHGLGYAWLVVRNLLVIGIALSVFNKVSSPFEVIVVALLVLLMTDVAAHFDSAAKRRTEELLALSQEFRTLGEALGTPVASEEDLREWLGQVQEGKIRSYINLAGTFVIWVIALWNLLKVTVLS
jgi:hypothetical protein